MTFDQIQEKVLDNQINRRPTYDGLTTSQIADYSRVLMFGENDEAFPSDAEWAAWVD